MAFPCLALILFSGCQRRYHTEVPCPKTLWVKSWEQATLLPWTRYAPPIKFIDCGAPLQAALQWSSPDKTGCTVLQKIDIAVAGILCHRGEACSQASEAWNAQMSLAWLKSAPVEKWYMSLTQLQKMYLCTLLHHISSRCHEISQHDGYFIALNYAVRWLIPFYAASELTWSFPTDAVDSCRHRHRHGGSKQTCAHLMQVYLWS